MCINGALLASLLFGRLRYGKPDVQLTFNALLAALIAISAGADSISTGAALATGIVAGLLAPFALLTLDLRFHIDDVSGAAAAAIVGGAWGTLATGISLPAASFSQRMSHIVSQAEGIAVIGVASILISAIGLFRPQAKSS